MPCLLRKCQKCHGYTNALIPTTEDQIASIFSNAHSNDLSGFSPIGLYYAAQLNEELKLITQDYQQ